MQNIYLRVRLFLKIEMFFDFIAGLRATVLFNQLILRMSKLMDRLTTYDLKLSDNNGNQTYDISKGFETTRFMYTRLPFCIIVF